MSLPEKWVLLVAGPATVDPSTGRTIPGAVVEVPWTGLVQQRPLTGPAEGLGSTEFAPGHETTGMVLLLDPGLTPHPRAVDRFRDEAGAIWTIQGKPRIRRPARRSRRPAYIAVQVHNASDIKETP